MTRREGSIPPGWFDSLYAGDPDPWRFASSDYEAGKYAATLEALPRARYARAFEAGCSIGVLTAMLGRRCDALLAIDPAEGALGQARRRCAGLPGVAFARGLIPADWPPGPHDLVILSEVLYYLDAADLARAALRLRETLAPGGDAVLVHWTGATDYPLTGDGAAEGFIEAVRPVARQVRHERAERYRIDVLTRA